MRLPVPKSVMTLSCAAAVTQSTALTAWLHNLRVVLLCVRVSHQQNDALMPVR